MSDAVSQDVQRRLAQGPITAFQLTVIALCVGLNMLDGFDVLAMSFAASGVKADWHLHDGQLGALLSAGLVGMGLGSLTLGPCADRWGRRIIVLLSVALAGLGMLGSALTRDYAELLALRVLTGIGIGGTIASVAVIVSEYAPDTLRGTALAIYATGYSIGATIGGALAAYAIPRYGWRAAFVIGGTLSLLMLPLAWRKLPESLDFLLTRRPPSGLRRVNAVLRSMGQPSLTVLAEPLTVSNQSSQDSVGARLRLLVRPSTLLVWIVFFCTMAGFYFILSWTPRLLNAAGLSAGQGMTGGVGPPLYPTAVRTTGMGWAIGIGRFGAILAPLASGALLDRGWLPAQLYFFFSAPFVVAAVAIFLIGPARAIITCSANR